MKSVMSIQVVKKYALELSKISQIEKVGLEVTVNVITVFTDSILLGIEFHIQLTQQQQKSIFVSWE